MWQLLTDDFQTKPLHLESLKVSYVFLKFHFYFYKKYLTKLMIFNSLFFLDILCTSFSELFLIFALPLEFFHELFISQSLKDL